MSGAANIAFPPMMVSELEKEADLYVSLLPAEHMSAMLHPRLRGSILRAPMADPGNARARRFQPEAVRAQLDEVQRKLEQAIKSMGRTEFASC